MLESIRIENFRGFQDHTVPLREASIIVGANNAGKSTLVEALRLVALVAERYRANAGRMSAEPSWMNHSRSLDRGVVLPQRGMPSRRFAATLFHGYDDPPAVVTATYSNASEVIAFVGPEAQIYGVAREPGGAGIERLRGSQRRLRLTEIAVQPQVAPLLREERLLQEETVLQGEGTYLAPQHFRNQLWLSKRKLAKFRRTAEETWPGLQIRDLIGDEQDRDIPLQLNVRDGGFVGEAGLMGHGLQMWLQIVWFLTRASTSSLVVLDEPDVYMHPDLQRRLLSLVRDRFAQLLIATHSIEIISDVDPRSVLSIDRREARSEFVDDLSDLQGAIDRIGTIQNLQVARLLRSRSFCMIEGGDLRLLRALQRAVAPDQAPIDLVPHTKLGGRGGWKAGLGSDLPKRNVDGERIRSYALLDRDYFPPDEIEERYREARDWGVQLRVWERKEIESYLLEPSVIARLLPDEVSAERVAGKIDDLAEEKRKDLEDAIAVEVLARNKKAGLKYANQAARERIDEAWRSQKGRRAVIPGKEVLSDVIRWAREEFETRLSVDSVAAEFTRAELDEEVLEFLTAVADERNLRGRFAVP